MAEFKLGRIRFVWQGDWAANVGYVADDVVSFGGKSYICIQNHTSNTEFNIDFESDIPKWDIVSDGTSWKADWQPEVEYAPGDVVKYGANVYICENGHTSATFAVPDYLGLEANLADWTSFATSFDWRASWTPTTRYKINDLVRYGSYVYVCNTAHVSSATTDLGLEANQANWTLFSEGLVYTGEWTTSTRYRVNDLVKYGGNIWIATAAHNSVDFEADDAYWESFIEGFQFEDSWNNTSNYQVGDTVTYGGYIYVAKTNNTGSQPTSNPLDWDVFTTGFKFQGDWGILTNYKVGDVVRLGGNTYVAQSDNVGSEPPASEWEILNTGINWTISSESFLQTAGVNAIGSGSGAKFDIVKTKTVYSVTVSTGFAGTGYNSGDVITIAGNIIGGTTPANDLTITVSTVNSGEITGIAHVGVSSTWKATQQYSVGDVVIFGASSFICITKHTASINDRPDNDLTATYWNLLTLGSEALALTTDGDMVYYGENGPTRLPVGIDGQILRATDGVPAWANYGLIDNVVYIGPLGTDEPAPSSGLTIDKPWRSVRYALEQVRDGYLNPQAKHIIKNNKEFLMKEVTSWVKHTYRVIITEATTGTQTFTTADTSRLDRGMPIVFDGTVGGVTAGTIYYVDQITSSTTFRISDIQNSNIPRVLTTQVGQMKGDLAYDSVKCERDTGYIVDALAYDISRGGTLKTVEAAKAYYTVAGNLYINGTFGSQDVQTVEAYTHLKNIVAKVLDNKQPVSFQHILGIPGEERSVQIIDLSLTAEQTAKDKANALVDIITTGIEAGSATAIPTASNPNTTVFIKTGTYNEILPIVIPEYTAIVGDELRTSVVQPTPAIDSLETDANKTTSALNRIKEVIPALMQNVEIEKTTGNTGEQAYINGYAGNSLASNRLTTGTDLISEILTEGLDVIPALAEVGLTPTSGTDNASDAGFADAVAQIEANLDFIVAEQTAWINAQIAGNIAPFTNAFTYNVETCERDTRYILDALRYDLTYGGNLETTVAARSYFVNGNPVYGTGKKDETLATYAHLKSVVGDVITETSITVTSGNTETQDVSGTPGSAAAEAYADARVQDIYDTIDTDGTLPTLVLPDTSWVSSTLTTVNTGVAAKTLDIQNAVIDYTNTNYGDYTYDSAKCRRDSLLLQTNSTYDVALGTNYNAVRDGLAYRRQMSKEVIDNQLTETVGAITQEKTLIEALMADGTAITRNTQYWNEVIDIIQNGTASADTITYSDPGGVAAKTTARTELQANRQDMIDDLTAWISTNYPNLDYTVETCERDTGRIIDAVSYDIQYGGNSAIIEAARAYFIGYAQALPLPQRDASAAAMAQLAIIATDYMSGATEEGEVADLLQILVDVITSGDKIDLPATIYPSTAWVDAGIKADADAVLADTSVVPGVLQYITNTYSNFVYDHAKCSRDVGFMLDALRYDIMFGSTFSSLKAGMSYQRGIASAQVVLDNQLEATLDTIDVVRAKVREITTGTAAVNSNTTLIKDIIVNNNIPGSFTISDPTDYDTGFFNSRRLIVANKSFLQDEVEAYMDTNYNSIWSALSQDDKDACLRDMGFIIDALEYDLTYRGNLETIVAARSYYSLGVFVEPSNQKTAALAVQTRLADIIDDVATGVAITRSTGNTTTQDVSGTAGSAGSAAFAVDRINEIKETIDSGDAPAAINPSLAWVDPKLAMLKTVVDSRKAIIQESTIAYINYMYPDLSYNEELCSRDVGYMLDAIVYDVIFGSNFRSAKAGMSYQRGIASTGIVLANQLEPTIDTVDFINEQLTSITIGVESDLGTREYADNAAELAEIVKDVLNNGLAAVPGIKMPSITGHNTAALTHTAFASTGNATGNSSTFGDGADQLQVNRAFIMDEVRHWLEDSANGFDTYWSTFSNNAQDRCIRDVGYIVDAVRYDMMYGGNSQSLVAGSAYYSNFLLTIGIDELPATLGAYARMREVIGQVTAETAVTTSPGVTEVQDTTGSAGNSNAVEFAQDRVDDVLDWINNAEANPHIEIASGWALPNITDAYNRLVDRRYEIQEDVVYWVEKFWQKIEYNQDTCRRDAGLMIDAITRDMLTGSNFASIKAGMSYYRGLSSTKEVRDNEKLATIGAINFLKQKLRHVAATTATSHAEVIIDDITSYINGGKRPALLVLPTLDLEIDATTTQAAATSIWENKEFIKTEVLEFLDAEYPNIEYNRDTCARDVDLAIHALRYDMTYGGTTAVKQAGESYYVGTGAENIVIDPNDKAATIAAFEYMQSIVSELAQNRLDSPGAIQEKIAPKFRDPYSQVVGTVNDAATSFTLMQTLIDLIDFGPGGAETLDMVSILSNVITTLEVHNLKVGDEISFLTDTGGLLSEVTYYVNNITSTTQFTLSETFGGTTVIITDEPGGGLGGVIGAAIVEKRIPDLTNVTSSLKQQYVNMQGSKANIQNAIVAFLAEGYPTLEYNQEKCLRDVGLIIDAVGYDMMLNSNYRTLIAALSYARGAQAEIVLKEQKTATVQSYRELKNQIATFVINDKTAVKRCNQLMDIIIQMLDVGINETPEMSGTVTYYNNPEVIKGVDILKTNAKFLAHEATAHVKQSFGGTATGIADSPGTITFSTPHNFIKGDPIYFDSNAFGGLVAGTTYYVSAVPSTTTLEVAATRSQVGNDPIVLTGGVGSSVARYWFDEALCRRDMERYVGAIAYDLQYPGNYKSLRAAQLYLNAVNGSERSDMFYVRNSTGVRNQTLNGLRGHLTELNENGTRRPTAGAFVALDPGFGPWDSEAWITNKSPYIQNVTNFGVGCVGNKIDGALHAGGNRSMVANDFTQVLSDGIGVWCSGNNSLTELVSVFCYYNYSGYIADLGGRIRATNGNSSYGTYGVIAEGTDTGEVPIFAEVDNLSAEAFASEVITDGANEVYRLEFDNAGRNYSNAQFAISGSGFNANVIMDEYRDGGIFETRLIDLDDNKGVGGEEYVTAKNVAQGGNDISITIAATDTALSGGYNGMRVILTAGTGVGQFANILGFNNGTKVASIYKDNVGPFTITDTNATGNIVTVTGPTEQIYVGMPVYVASSVGGLLVGNTPSNVYYVITDNRDGTIVLSETDGGAAVTLTTTTGQSVAMYEAGWEHAVPGTPDAPSLDLTTGYTIEPRITYNSPGFDSTATTVTSNAYEVATHANGNFYALPYAGDQVIQSSDGETWADVGVLPGSFNWNDVTFGGGFGCEAEVIIGGLGGSGAVLEAELGELNSIGLPGPTQIAKVNVINGGKGFQTAPSITFTPTLGGGGASAVCTVLNGSIQEVIITSTGAGYSGVPNVTADTDKVTEVKVTQSGRGYKTPPTITLTGGGATTQATLQPTMENEGVLYITLATDVDNNILNGEGYTSTPTITIEDSNAKFVAITEGSINNAYISLAGIENGDNWTAGSSLPNSNFREVIYGNGTFTAVGGAGGVGSGATSTDGSTWTGRTMTALGAGVYSSVAYGQGKFVAVNEGGVGTDVSTNGIVWAAGGNLPSSEDWTSVAYGNGRFVTIANNSRAVAYSIDEGVTWYAAPGGLPDALDWKTVKYGQGLFMAVAEGTDVIATSWDGITWTKGTVSASGTWHALAHGRVDGKKPRWVALTNTADTVATVVDTGSTARARLAEADGAIISTRMIEPGNAYPNGEVTSTTALNTITIDSTARLEIGQPITFVGLTGATLVDDKVYYINTIPSSTTITISLLANTGIPVVLETVEAASLSGASWKAGPIAQIVDPNATSVAPIHARQGDGVLANPTFINRGSGYTTATSEGSGDGFADLFQPATFVAVRGLYDLPEPGSNVEFAGIDNTWFKLVAVNAVVGEAGDYSATFQISPGLKVIQAPLDGTRITTTNKYSQVRLTGHDFLYIGTGNKADTNYPYVDITTASIDRQQLSSGGGRVFYTSTDQDGNFNVGGLFGVQQSTGTATLDADAFNLAGLQSLQLQGIGLGIGSAIITQFSTDPFFTANSDSIVPTQRAIKSYITAQIGGGQSSLNVNSLTAGVVFIANDEITTTSGGQLNIKAKMNFTGGIDGAPVALGFFLAR